MPITRRLVIAATARTCDLILICLDAMKPITHKKLIEHELEGFGIRLNKSPPNIEYRKKDKGGVGLVNQTKSPLTLEECKSILQEYRVHNADIIVRGDDVTADDLIDVIEGSRVYVPCIYVINKIDQITLEELNILDRLPNYCPICAYHEASDLPFAFPLSLSLSLCPSPRSLTLPLPFSTLSLSPCARSHALSLSLYWMSCLTFLHPPNAVEPGWAGRHDLGEARHGAGLHEAQGHSP